MLKPSVLPHLTGTARRSREQHPHPSVVGEPDIWCHVHHLRPGRHRGPPKRIPRPGLVLPVEAGARGQQGGHPQSRVRLHPARPHLPEEPLALDGPPRKLLPVHASQELIPHCPQNGQSATFEHGSVECVRLRSRLSLCIEYQSHLCGMYISRGTHFPIHCEFEGASTSHYSLPRLPRTYYLSFLSRNYLHLNECGCYVANIPIVRARPLTVRMNCFIKKQ